MLKVLGNHEYVLLTQQCMFNDKIAKQRFQNHCFLRQILIKTQKGLNSNYVRPGDAS